MSASLSFNEREEFVKFASKKNIKIINLCHIPEDGRLKTLSFSAVDKRRVGEILEFGERVDGSSLFTFIEPGRSDIYIIPRLEGAFINPFAAASTVNVLCDYLDENGKPLHVAPANVLERAEKKLLSSSKITLRALAELEFYVISQLENGTLFPEAPDRNYHESSPFARFEDLRNEILATLADIGVATKYGHSEVGRMQSTNNLLIEQHEVEFMSQNLAETAVTIAIAKWVVRNVCSKFGVSASFSPKINLEHAGSGMHIHLCAQREGRNIISNPDGTLSDSAKEMIGGILNSAPSLAAFANTTPVSYLRFIARKESPMHICWGIRNRLALVRIPLWWNYRKDGTEEDGCRATFEYRAPDALSNTHLLLAGMTVAVNYGLQNAKKSRKIAKDLLVETGTDKKNTEILPRSCVEAAKNLERDRQHYEADGIFPKRLVDKTIEKLKGYKDDGLWKNMDGKPDEVAKLLKQFLHEG